MSSKATSSGLDVNKMFSKDSATDNLEMQNHDLKNDKYQDEINHNMNIILNQFKLKAKKNSTDKMTKDEVVKFLDSSLTVLVIIYDLIFRMGRSLIEVL